MEKPSIEKIRRLLEIFERERHCWVLLTPENIYVVRHNLAPYTLPVIPRTLPSHIMEGEHFVVADLRRLVSGSASSSKNPVIEASSRVQGSRGTSRSSASSSGDSSSSPPAGPERLLLPAQVVGPTPRVVKVKWKRASKRQNALGSKGEDFVPWVPTDTEGPQDLEEEERKERMTGLFNRYAGRKRKRQVISSGELDTDYTPSNPTFRSGRGATKQVEVYAVRTAQALSARPSDNRQLSSSMRAGAPKSGGVGP